MTDRQPGFYWVRSNSVTGPGTPFIAEWAKGGGWLLTGRELPQGDGLIHVLAGPLQPEEKPTVRYHAFVRSTVGDDRCANCGKGFYEEEHRRLLESAAPRHPRGFDWVAPQIAVINDRMVACEGGIDHRTWIATHLMNGILTSLYRATESEFHTMAAKAVRAADALLAALEEKS